MANRGETEEIREYEKLKGFAERLGINTSESENEIAIRLCDFVEADFNRKHYEPSQLVDLIIYLIIREDKTKQLSPQKSAKDILDARYARGELTKEEYLQMKKDIEGDEKDGNI
jgi:hydroxylamine reductase (hybrid-cluster protein)